MNKQRMNTVVEGRLKRLGWDLLPHMEWHYGEGLRDFKFGVRAGPQYSFSNMAHEIAHAIELTDSEWKRVTSDDWGLKIRSYVKVGGVRYEEPRTMQASARECRVFGIQKHILEKSGYQLPSDWAEKQGLMLAKYMEDWIMGGDDEKARAAARTKIINDTYQSYNFVQIEEKLVRACLQLHKKKAKILARENVREATKLRAAIAP